MMEVPMSLIHCADCGIPFAITRDLQERLRKCHNTFYCPRGHRNFYSDKSDEEKLRDQIKKKNAEIEQLRMDVQKLTKKPRKKKVPA